MKYFVVLKGSRSMFYSYDRVLHGGMVRDNSGQDVGLMLRIRMWDKIRSLFPFFLHLLKPAVVKQLFSQRGTSVADVIKILCCLRWR